MIPSIEWQKQFVQKVYKGFFFLVRVGSNDPVRCTNNLFVI